MSCVYFIQSAKFVKIGFTQGDPLERLAALQTGNPIALSLMAVVPDGTPQLEGAFHQEFLGDRHNGEWFRLTPDLRKVIVLISRGARPRSQLDIAILKDFKPNRDGEDRRHNASFDKTPRKVVGLRSRLTY